MKAKIAFVNVGVTRSVQSERKTYVTGIFKNPVKGRVKVEALGVADDSRADLTVHGGP